MWSISSVLSILSARSEAAPEEPEKPDRPDRRAHVRCGSTEDHQAPSPSSFSASCYRIVASKLTLAFIELEIRQFASAFSISSLALAASAFAGSVMVGFNVMAVN